MRLRNRIEQELPLGFISTCPSRINCDEPVLVPFLACMSRYLGVPRFRIPTDFVPFTFLLSVVVEIWLFRAQEMPISDNTRRDIPGLKPYLSISRVNPG